MAVGELLRQRWDAPAEVRHKGAVDLITDADLAAEALAVRMLTEATPTYGIIAEESAPAPGTTSACWYVDPLDGTTNFAHRFPHVAVSIALVRDGMSEVGVVYDPLRRELFSAVRGRGAHLNGRPMHVSATATLNDALLATGFAYDRRERAAFYLRHFQHFMVRSQGLRRVGSAALDLSYVAAGRLDAFWEWNLRSWDTAAGRILVAEAGGSVSDCSGSPHQLTGPHILASNGALHAVLVKEFATLLV